MKTRSTFLLAAVAVSAIAVGSCPGLTRLGMNVVRGSLRNRKTTRITSATEIISVRSVSCTEARMVTV